MPVRGSRPAPTLLWAAALAALAPDAFARAADDPPQPSSAGETDDAAAPPLTSWDELIAACAHANTPLETAQETPFPTAMFVEDTSHAIAVRYGAPLVAAPREAAPFDPWIEATDVEAANAEAAHPAAHPGDDAEALGAPLIVPVGDIAPAEDPAADLALAHLVAAAAEAAAPAAAAATAEPAAEAPANGPLVAVDAGEPQGDADDAGEAIPLPDPMAPQAVRHRPGQPDDEPAQVAVPVDPGAVAPPQLSDLEACLSGDDHLSPCAVAIPDRWRLAENLKLVHPRWWDPYNQNTLKGDRPVPLPFVGDHWFFVGAAVSDTVIEPRSFPTPMGVQTTDRAGSLDVFGGANSLVLSQTFVASAALIEGSTAFKPQDIEARITVAGNINYAEVEERRILHVRPEDGTDRTDSFVGLQEAFIEKHLGNRSERYDFDSVRVGIQPFSSDFRGFLFQDNQLGVRLFGNRNNNRFQYNLAGFARLEKDTNSGLNNVTENLRQDYILFANAYRQDTPVPGITSQVTLALNANRETDRIKVDDNGFPVRPALIGNLRLRDYDVGYVGYNADGRLGRFNLTASAYYAFGKDRDNTFTGRESVIRSYFVALEPSVDFDWIRVRGSALYASGDNNPYDDTEEGFDAIVENPQFAGADTSYWIRQSIPFAGGGRAVSLNGRNGLLPSLRSSKDEGQSNFINPGLALLGVGADADILPQLRVSTSVNHLAFAHTEPLQALRMQGNIPEDIGWDVSAAATWRPGFIQNFVFRLSGAALAPGDGFKALFDNNRGDDFYYSVLFNATLSY